MDDAWTARPAGAARRLRLYPHGQWETRTQGVLRWAQEADAHEALSRRLKDIADGQVERPKDVTLRQVADEYLAYRQQQGKRSLEEDRRILLTRLLESFGDSLAVRRLTEAMIANYERHRL